ncbi:MAG: phage portal protein [Magnetococcales bacterium]|nr:phage portal protein [Magnetococcales bacterium]MBF0151539.1 phage portal protein [Magnetococcales bacterium]
MSLWRKFVHGVMPSRKAGYEAAASGRRLGNWQPGNEGVNALLFRDADLMRSRARDLVRRNAWAFNGVDSLVSNLVGTGIKPRSTHPDTAFKERVHALWLDWSREADAHGVQGFYGLQALAVRAMVEGGEVLARLRTRDPSDGLVVPLQIQLLEPEHLPFTLNRELPNGNRIRSGIEFDRIGRRVAYHLYREHPGERMAGEGMFGEPVPIPASEVIHLFRPLRPGQIRGEPWLTQALVKLHELDQYDDAELVRKKTAALIAGFITKPSPEFDTSGKDEEATPDERGSASVTWNPGTIRVLMPGEDVKFSEPADLGGQYGEFMKTQLRAVAVAIGVTYEQLTGDLSGVNYSSIRAGMVEFRRRMEQWQRSVIIHQFCRPVWERWMDMAVLSGAMELPGYARRRREYQAVKWIPQGWAWVDPQKEFNAVIMAIRSGLLSRDEAVATYGYDAEEIDREIADTNARADNLGLVLDSDPRRRTRTGAAVQDGTS